MIKNKKKGILFWITGLPGAGKTSIANKIIHTINKEFGHTILFNGDDIRKIFELKDYSLIGRSIKDVVIEPLRSIFIPEFDELKKISFINGALGFGISGSGPSVFALSKGLINAKKVGESLKNKYNQLNLDFDIHISTVNENGIKIIEFK